MTTTPVHSPVARYGASVEGTNPGMAYAELLDTAINTARAEGRTTDANFLLDSARRLDETYQ